MTPHPILYLILTLLLYLPPVLMVAIPIYLFALAVSRKAIPANKMLICVAWLVISIGCTGTEVWFYNLDAPIIEKGIAQAGPLLAAIDAYKQTTGKYPATLRALTPDYIAEIPWASWRQKYCYDLREDGLSFTLGFIPRGEAIGDGWRFYSSKSASWHTTDSSFTQPCVFID